MKPFSVDDSEGVQGLEPACAADAGPDRSSKSSRKRVGVMALVLGLTAFAVPVAFVAPVIVNMMEQDRLAEEGVAAQARILAVRETNSKVNGRWVFELDLQVLRGDGSSFRASVSQSFSVRNASALNPGGYAGVRYDSKEPKRVVVVSVGGPPSAQPDITTPAAKSLAPPSDVGNNDPVCRKTFDCCRTAMGESGQASCDSFLQSGVPPAGCAAALPSYQTAAQKAGRVCD